MRLLLALAFLFSGIVKLTDPHGTQYKIEDYAAAFGLGAWLFDGLALLLAVALAVLEFLLGVCLFYGIRRRFTSSVAIGFMLLMTPLSLYLVIANPVSDCGCFGDALLLSNGQTLAKNVVLLAFAVAVCRWYDRMPRLVTLKNQWMVALYSLVFACLYASINLWRLPLIDFRPYRLGADIRQAWAADREGTGSFVTTFIMEKDGVRQEFSLEDYPDSTWTLVDTKTVLQGGATHSGVGDLIIQNAVTGEDITETILYDEGYTFLLVAPYLEKADDGVMDKLLPLYDYTIENAIPFYCLTSSGEKGIAWWKEMTGAEYPFCYADATVLKTIVRSNPGLVLLHDGKVVGKWSSMQLPSVASLDARLEQPAVALSERVTGIAVWYVCPLLLFLFIDAAGVGINRVRMKAKS